MKTPGLLCGNHVQCVQFKRESLSLPKGRHPNILDRDDPHPDSLAVTGFAAQKPTQPTNRTRLLYDSKLLFAVTVPNAIT